MVISIPPIYDDGLSYFGLTIDSITDEFKTTTPVFGRYMEGVRHAIKRIIVYPILPGMNAGKKQWAAYQAGYERGLSTIGAGVSSNK